MTGRALSLLLWMGLFVAGLMLVVLVVVPQQRSAVPQESPSLGLGGLPD